MFDRVVLYVDWAVMCEVRMLTTLDDHGDSESNEDEDRQPEQQTVDDVSQRPPFLDHLAFFLQSPLTTCYLHSTAAGDTLRYATNTKVIWQYAKSLLF